MRLSLYSAVLLPAVALLVLQGCATGGRPLPEPASAEALPPVAAAFRTHIQHDGRDEIADWRFWRSADRVHRENLQSRTGDLWQRDGATLFHTMLFHAERRGIEFEAADLQMTGSHSSWAEHAQIVSPVLLQQLRLGKAGRTGAIPYQDFSGEIEGVKWRVRMRKDLMLPVRIERRSASETLRIELIESHPLAQAPWSPPAAEGYGMVDFADLGDHERDPFVQRLQAYMGIGHGHEH